LLAVLSLVGFAINASTFYALGVVLPDMVRDEGWSFGVAGFGFTILGGAVGVSSYVPTVLIKRFGVRPTMLAGAGAMIAGFACLASTRDLASYFLGAGLCGVGYQMMAFIPGTHVIAAVFKKRAAPMGAYFTITALGGVAGPALALAIGGAHHDWRAVWWAQASAILVVGMICAATLGGRQWFVDAAEQTDLALAIEIASPKTDGVWRTMRGWTVADAVRTPQYYVLLAAYFIHLAVIVTVSSWSVAHLAEHGVAVPTAVAMLSLEALMQTAVRAVGGLAGDRIDPRYLLIGALGALAIGMGALSIAHDLPMMLVYAVGCGAGFGLTALAVALLLLNYYGRAHNLELFSLTCLIGAVSALGPALAGKLRDVTGGFGSAFEIYAAVAVVVALAAIIMRPPTHAKDVK
jgi:MFS family permease